MKYYSFLNIIFSFIKRWANLNFPKLLDKATARHYLLKVSLQNVQPKSYYQFILPLGVIFTTHQNIKIQRKHSSRVKLVYICMIMATRKRASQPATLYIIYLLTWITVTK